VADRHFDRHVKRTASRPVTSGAVSVREALSLGAVLALMALALVLTTNGATVVWAVGALLVTIAYPYAKRWVSMPQAVLGLAFSFGIPMAFTAVQAGPLWALWQSDGLNGLFSGDAVVTAWQATPATVGWLLLGNVCWVLAYDTEYAMVDRDDDLKIGMKTSAITLGRWDVPAVMLFYMGCLLFTALPLYLDGIHALFFVSLLPAAVQIVWHYRLIRTRQREGCFRAFRANHWLGLTLFAGVVLALWVARGL
jgi:4-hydroxybenzoate polyprenyltransferase